MSLKAYLNARPKTSSRKNLVFDGFFGFSRSFIQNFYSLSVLGAEKLIKTGKERKRPKNMYERAEVVWPFLNHKSVNSKKNYFENVLKMLNDCLIRLNDKT